MDIESMRQMAQDAANTALREGDEHFRHLAWIDDFRDREDGTFSCTLYFEEHFWVQPVEEAGEWDAYTWEIELTFDTNTKAFLPSR